MNPQVSLIDTWGDIYVGYPSADGSSVNVGTRNPAGTLENLQFYLLIL